MKNITLDQAIKWIEKKQRLLAEGPLANELENDMAFRSGILLSVVIDLVCGFSTPEQVRAQIELANEENHHES